MQGSFPNSCVTYVLTAPPPSGFWILNSVCSFLTPPSCHPGLDIGCPCPCLFFRVFRGLKSGRSFPVRRGNMNLKNQPLCLQTHTSQNNSSDVKIRTDHWNNSIIITATTAVYENWTTRIQPHQTRCFPAFALNPRPRSPHGFVFNRLIVICISFVTIRSSGKETIFEGGPTYENQTCTQTH